MNKKLLENIFFSCKQVNEFTVYSLCCLDGCRDNGDEHVEASLSVLLSSLMTSTRGSLTCRVCGAVAPGHLHFGGQYGRVIRTLTRSRKISTSYCY